MTPPTLMQLAMILNALVIVWIISAYVATAVYTAIVASAKGYSFKSWLAGGLLFSAVALIAAAGLHDRREA